MACKFDFRRFLDYPVHTSLFVMDFSLVSFVHIHFPFFLSVVMVGGLVYLSAFFGAKFADCFAPNTPAKDSAPSP